MKKSQENEDAIKWDKLLQIHTTGRDDSRSDQYRLPIDRQRRCFDNFKFKQYKEHLYQI